jgi:hypothetical protein
MPQLDKFSFSSQIFWLIIIFFALHYFFLRDVLPRIAASLKYRHHILKSYAGVLNSVSTEKSKILESQRDTFIAPIRSVQVYLFITNQYINSLLLKELSNIFLLNLYSSKSMVFDELWRVYKLRSDLKY